MATNDTSVPTLTAIIDQLGLYVNMLGATAGTLGGLCNLLVFTAPTLRKNASVFYLLGATVFQILSLAIVVPSRVALDNFGSKLDRQSIGYCKFRSYSAVTWPQVVTYFMLWASIDRFLATSRNVNVRAWSHIKVARVSSLLLVIVCHFCTIPILIFNTIENGTCRIASNSGFYPIYHAVYLLVIVSILPHLLMMFFSILTFRQVRQRVQPTETTLQTGNQTRRVKRFEFQLLFIIMIQIFVSTLLVLLRLGSSAYSTVTRDDLNKTAYARVVENFSTRLGIALYYFSFALSFYASTLASKYFREIFWKRVLSIVRFVKTIR